MIFTTRARYGVMAIIDMIQCSVDKPVSLISISNRQNISLSYLEQIFAKLKKAGIVNSVKGPNGGYFLAKKPDQLSIADIICGIGEPIKMTRCNNKSVGCMKDKKKCQTHDLWSGLESNIRNYLGSFLVVDFLSVKDLSSADKSVLKNKTKDCSDVAK